MSSARRAVNQANIAIYTIDARGLFADPMDEGELRSNEPSFVSKRSSQGQDPFANTQAQARESGSGQQGQSPPPGPRPRQAVLPPPATSQGLRRLDATIDGMVMLADQTGGRAFYNSNDIDGPLRAALDETEVTYRLAFEPAHNRWDGSFRRIKVRLKRGSFNLRHRQGYLAQSDAPPEAAWELSTLRETAASPIGIAQIGLRATTLPAGQAGQLRLRVLVMAPDLTLRAGENEWNGAIDVYLEMADEAGAPLWSDARRVSLSLTKQLHERAMQGGLPLNKTLPRSPEARQLRIVIRDVRTGAIGSLRIPLAEVK